MNPIFRTARTDDLIEIIKLLGDDELGKTRENVNEFESTYRTAFNEIQADPNNELIVGVLENKLVAVLQVNYIPNLTLKGTKRALIEGVRVSSNLRGSGIGKKLFHFVFDRAKAKGCGLIQLTTNKSREEAIRFYEGLGFNATHEGMKLNL